MVGHYAPGKNPVTLAIEMQDGFLDSRGNIWPAQPARTQPDVELTINSPNSVRLTATCLDNGPRETIGEAERHELHCFRRIEVRQVASGIPAFVLNHLKSALEARGPMIPYGVFDIDSLAGVGNWMT